MYYLLVLGAPSIPLPCKIKRKKELHRILLRLKLSQLYGLWFRSRFHTKQGQSSNCFVNIQYLAVRWPPMHRTFIITGR